MKFQVDYIRVVRSVVPSEVSSAVSNEYTLGVVSKVESSDILSLDCPSYGERIN